MEKYKYKPQQYVYKIRHNATGLEVETVYDTKHLDKDGDVYCIEPSCPELIAVSDEDTYNALKEADANESFYMFDGTKRESREWSDEVHWFDCEESDFTIEKYRLVLCPNI